MVFAAVKISIDLSKIFVAISGPMPFPRLAVKEYPKHKPLCSFAHNFWISVLRAVFFNCGDKEIKVSISSYNASKYFSYVFLALVLKISYLDVESKTGSINKFVFLFIAGSNTPNSSNLLNGML